MRRPLAGPGACLLVLLITFSVASDARADDTPTRGPAVVVGLHETFDLWRNTTGGLAIGYARLNKLQLNVEFDGEGMGWHGWKGKLQYFHTSGQSLSGGRVGDIQTVSNIEAPAVDRLMEAWIERRIGERAAVRVGLMDLNADFDSIEPAGLFINSSHGIAPDLSRSGLNGPSIFPVSSLGVQATWSPSRSLVVRAAAFDGVPGDPDRPYAFTTVKLSRRDGALLIGQADWTFADGVQASAGAWSYTASFDRLDRPGTRQSGQAGAYAFVEGSLAGSRQLKGWIRAGFADPDVDLVASYLGFGVVWEGPFRNRPDDRLGLGVARSGIGGPARALGGLPAAETNIELTYRFKVTRNFAIQPDVQYVRHPASQAGLADALVIGLRLTASARHAFGGDGS